MDDLPETDDRDGGQRTMRFDRITTESHQMGGLPCIRVLHIPVAAVVDMVAEGMVTADTIDAFPDLQPEDIEQARIRIRPLPIGG